MNIHLHSFASTSKSNCYLLTIDNNSLLIELGVPTNEIKNHLKRFQVKNLVGSLLSHEHVDHFVKGNEVFNVYSSKKTLDTLNIKGTELIKNKFNKIGNSKFKVKPFEAIHNSVDPLIFLIKYKKYKLAFISDTEKPSVDILNKLKGCHTYLIEANYDIDTKIENSRVAKHQSKAVNHLRLQDAIDIFNIVRNSKTKYLQFIHLSSSLKDYSLLEHTCKTIKKQTNVDCDFKKKKKILIKEFKL